MEMHLASMENVTCWAFRKLCKAATDSYTGMISANYLIRRTKAWKEADFFPIENQRQWLQIVTSKEKECSELLSRLQRELSAFPEKNNLYGIQLNVSCPSPEFVNLGQGAALIKRPGKIKSLIQSLLSQRKYKISLKIRLGFHSNDKEKGILKVLEALQEIKDPNFSHIVIHFKYANSPSFTPYDYSLLNEICKFNVPIIINGGITSLTDYKKIISPLPKNNSIKGFMIGRAALENPDCFSSSARTKEEILSEFKAFCEQHPPKDIYIKRISELAPWAKITK